MDQTADIRRYLASAGHALAAMSERAEAVGAVIGRLAGVVAGGGKILTCGNGGSAAEALHLAEEMMGRYRKTRRPISAVCLNADPTAITCIANDWDYAEVFARQVEGLGRRGDALVALSTSGKSASIVRALERARGLGVTTVGLLGPAGSPAEAVCDLTLTFPGGIAASHVQELHLAFIHMLLERLDQVAT